MHIVSYNIQISNRGVFCDNKCTQFLITSKYQIADVFWNNKCTKYLITSKYQIVDVFCNNKSTKFLITSKDQIVGVLCNNKCTQFLITFKYQFVDVLCTNKYTQFLISSKYHALLFTGTRYNRTVFFSPGNIFENQLFSTICIFYLRFVWEKDHPFPTPYYLCINTYKRVNRLIGDVID